MTWNKSKDILALMVGHGTQLNGVWDSGCTYGKYTEAELMLKIVKVAVNMLRKSGVRVITDADKGNNRNMKSSVAWANRTAGVKLYMSLHCDYKLASAGVAPLYVSKAGKKFAVSVGKKVAKLMGMKWKGAFKRTDLYELNATIMPACIFEAGSIGATKDLKYLKDYKKYGKALAKAICEYLGVKYYVAPKKEETKPAETKPAKPKKTNAQKIAEKAKELAYSTAATKEAKYPSGKPKDEYKKALKKAYPNRKKWGAAPKAGASCDVFAGTVIRSSGVDKKFPRSLNSQYDYLEKSDDFKRIKADIKNLKDGDIIIYKKLKDKNGKEKGHICIYAEKKIKHAQYKKYYPRTQKCVKKMLNPKGKKFVRVYRPV